MSFEQDLKDLEKCAEKLKNGNITLDEAIRAYEDGMVLYEKCAKTLEDTKQKIEEYGRR